MKKRILIVDDDASIRRSLQKVLVDSGYEVTVAGDGKSAEAEFGGKDLLILDLYLPIQDGWDILGQVNGEFPLLPVIVITGLVDQLDERTIPGAAAFLEKPIEVPLLLQTIERLLAQSPEERFEEANRSAESWQSSPVHGGYVERMSKTAPPGIRKFRSRG